MKTNIFSVVGMAAAALLTVSCSDNPDYILDSKEKMAEVSTGDMSVELSTDEIEISRAAADIDVNTFSVNVTNADGERVYNAVFGEVEPIIKLPVAKGYTVTVENHAVENAAWESPYYAGSKTFDVEENKINSIGVVEAKFANIRVSVRYTPELKALLGNDVFVTVRCSATGSSLDFAASETRSGYFKALDNSTTLAAEFSGTVGGTPAHLLETLADVKAGQHRIITFDVKKGDDTVPDEYGNITIDGDGSGVKLDNGLYLDVDVTTEDVNGNVNVDEEGDNNAKRPGQDDEGGGDVPVPEAISITAPELLFDTPQEAKDGMVGTVNIHADKGVANLFVTIVPDPNPVSPDKDFGADLVHLGVPTSFDLAHTTDENREILEGFKFPVDDQVLGKTSVSFDISTFIPLLNNYPGTHKFVLKVVDAEGGEGQKSLIFIAK